MKEAGIDDLKIFKHFNMIDNLCSGVLEYSDFMKVKTDVVYMKLLRNQMISKIEKEYAKIKRRKIG